MSTLAERRAQAAARGWPTPRRLRALLWAALLGVAALGLANETSPRDAQEALAAASDAQARSALASWRLLSTLAASSEPPPSSELLDAAVSAPPESHEALRSVSAELDRYRELLAAAQPREASALEARSLAQAHLRQRVLPAAERAASASLDALRLRLQQHQQTVRLAERLRLAVASLALALLLYAQVSLARRTRRLLSGPLLAASLLLLGGTVHLTRRASEASASLSLAASLLADEHAGWQSLARSASPTPPLALASQRQQILASQDETLRRAGLLDPLLPLLLALLVWLGLRGRLREYE